MKKLFVLFIIVLFAAPAMAVDWNFYGSARMATYWVDNDFGDFVNGIGDDDDADLQWDLQGNSRLGAKVKADAVSGQFEFGVNEATVTSRRLYGVWNFGAGTLKVGKDYTPISQFISGQVFNADLGLLGYGTAYGSRFGQVALGFGGFNLALVTPNDVNVTGLAASDVDTTFPKSEASYAMGLDMFNFKVMGGYQTYEVEGVADSIDVDSYIVGLDAGVNFGAGYVKGAVSYGQNVANAGWNIWGTGAGVFNAVTFDFDDTETLMWALVAGFKVSDMAKLEAGFGYREDSYDVTGADDDEMWNFYVQAPLTLAPGVYVIPEFGYYSWEDDAASLDEGNTWYLGAKWQIDF